MPAPANAKLVVRFSDGGVQEYELDAEELHVGRDPSCEIRVVSPYISRRHALIRRQGDVYVIEDERSTNGLLINGRVVREPHPLISGDCVVLGDVSLTYEGPDDESLATAVYSPATTPVAQIPLPKLPTPAPTPPPTPTPTSAPTPPARVAGLCTILFTDLVDHTREVTRLGDIAGQRWLRRHTVILREQFIRFGGQEEKWTGDGFVVTFDSARRALQCAIEIQRVLIGHNQSAAEGAIHVRLGLNTGEVLREEGELFGNAVILAARVMAEAGPDQILISELMDRVIQPAGEFKTLDRGPVLLKGFVKEQHLYEVEWQDLAKD